MNLRFASFNTWPSAQLPSLGVVAKISARFSMPSALKCQIRKFICLPIGEYACHNTMPPRHFSHVPAPHSSTKERQGWRGGAVRRAKYEKYEKKAKNAKKCCAMMSKTRPSSRSMGATPGGARGARGAQSAACATWRRATTRGGGEERLGKERRARRRTTIARREEENFFKARKKAKIAKTPVFSTTLA